MESQIYLVWLFKGDTQLSLEFDIVEIFKKFSLNALFRMIKIPRISSGCYVLLHELNTKMYSL